MSLCRLSSFNIYVFYKQTAFKRDIFCLVLISHYHFLVPLSGIRGLRIADATFTTLTATWDAADGNVQGYKVIYIPTDGGQEIVVQFYSVSFHNFYITTVLK